MTMFIASSNFHRRVLAYLGLILVLGNLTFALPTASHPPIKPTQQAQDDLAQAFLNLHVPSSKPHQCNLPPPSHIKPREKADPEYDFIVVGGGAGGSTVAGRLSERPDFKVLLVESGGAETIMTDMAALWNWESAQNHDEFYETLPIPNAAYGLKDRKSHWPRGNILGGGSAINVMMYVRGPPRDYENWVEMGAKGWSWEEVLPFFKRTEGNRVYRDGPYHNTTGPMPLENPVNPLPLTLDFLEAGRRMGYPANHDYNGPHQKGFAWTQRNALNGRRVSTAKAFLEPAANRSNLHILTEAKVTQILFEGKRAVGIRYDRGCNHSVVIRARKEVIVSGGAMESPKLLLLSGVGPREHLKNMDIPIVAHLPGVGHNLQDHYTTPMHFFIDADEELATQMDYGHALTAQNLYEFACHGAGRLASGQIEAFAFLESEFVNGTGWPDIEMYFWPARNVKTHIRGDFTDVLMREYFNEYEGQPRIMLLPLLQRPEVRGRIELASSNPADKPLIWYPYFNSERDMKTMIWALKFSMKLMKQPSFAKYNPRLIDAPIPGCERFNDTSSDEYLECYARVYTMTMVHYSGSCKMGDTQKDPMAVVDPQLRVAGGIQGLRVCDASVMPLVVSANTNAATIMIGERCADFIKKDY